MKLISVHTERVINFQGMQNLDEFTDRLFEQLLMREGEKLKDADLSATLARGQVTISLIGIAQVFDAAVETARSAIDNAIGVAMSQSTDENQSQISQQPRYEIISESSKLLH